MSVSKAYYSGSNTISFLANTDATVTLTIWGGGGGAVAGDGGAGYGGSGGTCTFNATGKASFTYVIGVGGEANSNPGNGGFTKFTCGDLIITANGGGGFFNPYQPSVSVTDPSSLISLRSFSQGAAPNNYNLPDDYGDRFYGDAGIQPYGMAGNSAFYSANPGNPGIVIVTYTVSQKTVNLPTNVDEITVEIWGGGGGGVINTNSGYGGGGAKCVFNARGKTSYTFNIGLGMEPDGWQITNSTFSCGDFSILAKGGSSTISYGDPIGPGIGVITDPSNLIDNRLKEIYTGGSPTISFDSGLLGSEGEFSFTISDPSPQTYGAGGRAGLYKQAYYSNIEDDRSSLPGEPGVFILTYTLIQETVPGPPRSVIATAGGGQATVSWTEPENNGGSAIIDYTVRSSPGGFTATTSGTSATVAGLTGGTSYTFTVTARNSVGSSSASSPSNSVTVISFVYFSQPLSLSQIATAGGITTTSKKMSDLRGKTIFNTSGVAITVPASGSYNLSFFAANTFRTPTTVPDPPTNLTPTAGDAQVSLSWSAPTNNGGEAITGYTVKYSNGTAIATTGAGTTSYTVTALTNGTSYTFMVTANNNVGSSAPSSSVSVTPVAPVNNLMMIAAGYYYTDEEGGQNYVSLLNEYNTPYRILYTGTGAGARMTGGNSSPIYITFRTSAFTGETTVILNNVNYGNDGNLSVYFPYGIIEATATHDNVPADGSLTISQTRPPEWNEPYMSRRCQDASGNNITCP